MRSIALVVAAVGLASCGMQPTEACSPSSCASGCCRDNVCVLPSRSACGVAGAACVACMNAESCAAGQCVVSMSDSGVFDAGAADSGAGEDIDSGVVLDGGGSTDDAGSLDAGTTADAGTITDGGTPDAGRSDAGQLTPQWVLDEGITADQLGVLVNDADPVSVAIAARYVSTRHIPARNVVTLHFDAGLGTTMSVATFNPLKQRADEVALDAGLQAWLITWTQPYRVTCMSIGTAFAIGFDGGFCSTQGSPCSATTPISTYNDEGSPTRSPHRPFDTFGIRPTMMLATGPDASTAFELIDRGVASDGTRPSGDGYFFRTTDSARSVRYTEYLASTLPQWAGSDSGVRFLYSDQLDGGAASLVDAGNVLFYFQSLASVPNLATNRYLPGAIADHLTSFGGQVPNSGQMSMLRWIEAGATGSYGTVVEPCNFTSKFPATSIVTSHYFRGEPLIEAYWKSVQMPGEGLFIGEPLARPFTSSSSFDAASGVLSLETTMMKPGLQYAIDSAPSRTGPWTRVRMGLTVAKPTRATVTVPNATEPFYRLVRQ